MILFYLLFFYLLPCTRLSANIIQSLKFYSKNAMMNIKTLQIYSSDFLLNVLDLNCINLATEEDKSCKLDYWAKFFKATTWEEIKMLAMQNDAEIAALRAQLHKSGI